MSAGSRQAGGCGPGSRRWGQGPELRWETAGWHWGGVGALLGPRRSDGVQVDWEIGVGSGELGGAPECVLCGVIFLSGVGGKP